MNQVEPIVHNFAYGLDFLREIVADLLNDQMVMQSEHIKNHPAWVIGHLTFSCQAIGGEIGLEKWLPEDWGKRFGMGSQPTADVSAYPCKPESLATLADAQFRITEAVRGMSAEQLQQPMPDANYHDDLPSQFHAISQILVAHTAYHVGQTVVWRRSIGLKKAERPFL